MPTPPATATLATIAETVSRARLERGIVEVDQVRIALGQPINVSLALAAVFARVRMVRRREAVVA